LTSPAEDWHTGYPALENVHSDLDFSTIFFCFRTKQTDRQREVKKEEEEEDFA